MTPETTFVISGRPLSADYRKKLIGQDFAVDYFTLSQLRLLRPFAVIALLRRRRPRVCILAIEEPSNYTILPVLRVLAMFTRASSLQVAHPDLRRETFSRLRSWLSLAHVLTATFDGLFAMRASAGDVRRLIASPRGSARRGPNEVALYINPNLWFGVSAGGAVSHMSGVLKAFVDSGYRVDFASTTPLPSPTGASFQRLDVPTALGLPEEVNYYRFQRDVMRHLRNLTQSRRYDFIYQRLSIHNYVGVELSRATGLPLIVEYNGSEVWASEHWGRPVGSRSLALAAEELCLQHAHVVVVVSEALRREVLRRGVEPNRVVHYPNGFDPVAFSPDRFNAREVADLRAKLGLVSDNLVATFVGTFGKWHGVTVLATAIRRLADEERLWLQRTKLRFLLIGDGVQMAEVREILGPVSSEFVILPGLLPPSAIPGCLAASDMFLAPHIENADGSEFFGSPTKLFEYMGMSRAIIASRVGQIAEVLAPSARLEDLENSTSARTSLDYLALLVSPGEVDELIRAIHVLVSDPALRESLGAAARVRALERYTWRRHAEEILAGITGAVGPPERRAS